MRGNAGASGAGARIGGGDVRVSGLALALASIFQAGANECGEQRMRCERLRFEFRMELDADEPGMVGHLDDFDVDAVGSASRDAKSSAGERFLVLAVEFIAMAMAFGNFSLAVGFRGKRTGLELAGPRAETHGAAHFVH